MNSFLILALNIAKLCEVDPKVEIEYFNILVNIHYTLIGLDNKLYLRSSLLENNPQILEFNAIIKKVTSSDNYCLILLESGVLHKYNFIKVNLRINESKSSFNE